ncbi:hypothetical protein [Micromonospora chokoriensis]|uniref:Uncharacterized protein n=1 Tax=Micromonospora chokoriensis TaxID=356851 RepID=A0A1C4ZB36_9ACTN|nr:hypothetical protein [Micromonospora chokoriensis]SCF30134.1 hypothetical protein GA0070612_6109 [Micromonospora chokoriensis]
MTALCLAVPLLIVLWFWGRPLLTGRWKTPGWFAATAALSVVATAVTWFVGAFAGSSMNSEESCRQAGVSYDSAYRAAHWRESTRWFPLHDRCNATHDLVPAWVNPALVLLSLLAVLCVGAAVRLAVVRHRTTTSRARARRSWKLSVRS